MKRFWCLLVLLLTLTVPALAEETEAAALLTALQAHCPGLQTAVTDSWGDTAAAVFEFDGAKTLCILEKAEGAWRVTLENTHALVQEEPLPRLLMDTDDALFWYYDTYPRATYSVSRTGGVWGNVSQVAQSDYGDNKLGEDEVLYKDGQIVHNWYLFDENENMLNHSTEQFPAPWLAGCMDLASFDIARFPVIGEVEYDGEWPARAFLQQAASRLMPEYTFVSGSYSEGRLRFLMDRPDGARVFVGCGTGNVPTLVESSPLPKDTYYGVENFTNSLGINGLCVSISTYGQTGDAWGISCIMPYEMEGNEMYFGPNCVYSGNDWSSASICFGAVPWNDITKVDWAHLPVSFEAAAAGVDSTGWAVVSNPDPADRLHLRTEESTKGASLGKYYNGTPVRVVEDQGDWVQVEVLGQTGWMLKKFLDLSQYAVSSLSAMPQLQFKNGTASLFASTDAGSAYQVLDQSYGMLVAGIIGEEWFHVWFPETGVNGFVRQSELFPGNG